MHSACARDEPESHAPRHSWHNKLEPAESRPGQLTVVIDGPSQAVQDLTGPSAARDMAAGCVAQKAEKRDQMIKRSANWWQVGLAIALLVGLCLLILLPLGDLLTDTLRGPTTEADLIRESLLDKPLQQAVLATLAVGLLAVALVSLIAIPAAYLAMRASSAARVLIGLIAILPLTMPPFVSAAVLLHFQRVLDQTGIAPALAALEISGSHIALAAVFALHYLPLILLCLIAGLIRIDNSASESARNLGGRRLYIWRHIRLPLVTPAYSLGISLMLLRIFEDVGTPLMLGIEGMLAPQILLAAENGSYATPVLMAAVMALFVLSAMVVTLGWSSLSAPFANHWQNLRIRPTCRRRGAGATVITVSLVFGLGLLMLAPFVWLLLMSFGSDWSTGLAPTTMNPGIYPQSLLDILPALRLTLVWATAAGLLVVLLGTAIGSLTRGSRYISRMAVFTTTLLFALPGLALALAYVHGYGQLGLSQDDWQRFAWPALALVVALKQVPIARHLIATRLHRLHDGELASASSLGASGTFAALRIGLPSLSGVLGIAFLLGCLGLLFELSVTMLLIQGPPLPVTLHLFRPLLTGENIQTTASQALAFVLLTTAVLLVLWWLTHRVCTRIAQPSRHLSSPARTYA